MIPIRDPRGRPVAFGGRIIVDGEPKYLNSPETPLFDKGRTLYNLDRALPAARKTGRIIAVEGYMDVIALAQAGFEEAVAPLGTALTEHQLERLWRIAEVPILCFDGDAAGQKAAIRAAMRALPMVAPGRSLAFVTLPEGLDPDDLVRARGAAAFEELLRAAEPLVDRLWRHELAAEPLDTPEQRAGLKARLMAAAQSIADPSVRHEYVTEFRRRCDAQFAPPPRSFTPRAPRKPGQKWTPPPEPPSPAAQALRTGGIDRVLAKAVLAGLVRHPAEIARHVEILGSLRLADGALGRLFEAVVDVALEDQSRAQTLDSGRVLTILARSGFGEVASELLRADRMPFTFTQKGYDEQRAAADLDEAIAILVAGPAVDAAIAAIDPDAATRSDEAFNRQVTLIREKAALQARLANLMLDDKEASGNSEGY
jgi:DNA primase